MKKTISIIAIALCLVLCVPSVPCYAFDTSNLYARTKASVADFWDDPMQDHIQQCVTSLDRSNVNSIAAKVANLPNFGGAGDTFNKQYYAVFYWADAGYIMVYSFDDSSGYPFIFCPDNIDTNTYAVSRYRIVKNDSSDMNAYAIGLNDSSFSSFAGSVSNENGVFVRDWANGALLCTNIPVFVYNETETTTLIAIRSLYDTYTNYFPQDLPYLNQEGEIVTPSPEVEYESNSNHMFFKDCEIGFCYPKTSPAPLSFGGAYFYIKYQVDDWIVNHISDYNLVFYADAEVGNEVTNTIRYEIALDPDGCVTIPFSRIWSTPLTSKGFSVLVTDREIEDNFYKAYLYSLSPSGFVNFGNKAAASNQNSISGALSALASGGIQSFLYYINGDQIDFYSALSDVATSIAVKYNPYLINAFTLLSDGTNNSGLFEMQFDLVAGTEDVTDTGGLVNPDPFVPEDDPDFTPPSPTPGNSTTPGYNIVPSGYWQGIFNGVIGYDPGYRDLKNDLDADPDDNFTQYLAPFKNNEVGGFVGDFLDDMPTALKSIFIGGFGVLTLLGIYRFIRRG